MMMLRRVPFCFLLKNTLKLNKIWAPQAAQVRILKPQLVMDYTSCQSFGFATKKEKAKKKDKQVELVDQQNDSKPFIKNEVKNKDVDSEPKHEANNIINADKGNETTSSAKLKKKRIRLLDSRTYGHIMGRVMKTCKIYLDSTPEVRSQVDMNSRFYYVKRALDVLETKDQESFRKYLDETGEVFYHKKNQRTIKYQPKKPAKEKKDGLNQEETSVGDSNLEENKQEKVYTYRGTYCTKKGVNKYLETPENGPLLKGLIIDFLQPDNPDLQLFVSKDQDEKVIGKITTEAKPERNILLTTLKDHLDLTRKRFSKIDKTFHS